MTKIKYYGHSCFAIEAENGYCLVMDPYEEGSVPGVELPTEFSADVVRCSHGHYDHNASDRVCIRENGPDCSMSFATINVPHDDEGGAKRGMNDITIIEVDGYKIIHFGDLGRMLTDEEVETLKNADVAMVPCGGFYTIDASVAKQVIDSINPKLTILMHYRNDQSGFDVISHIDDIKNVISGIVSLDKSEITVGDVSGIITLTV